MSEILEEINIGGIDYCDIDNVIARLEHARDKIPEEYHASTKMNIDSPYEGCYEVVVEYYRLETEEEKAKERRRKEERKASQLAHARATIERLTKEED